MGAWDVSVTANDTARDLIDEYTCVFYKYSDDMAGGIKVLEEYFHNSYDDDDEEEVCSFYYSLADFMWKKGILTEDIKSKVIGMLDSGYGLELWAESGEKVLNKRRQALEKFREKITSPMGAVKKIKPNFNLTDIFTDGDLIAVQLHTKGKKFSGSIRDITQEEFEAADGKYVLMQRIKCSTKYGSRVVPEICDHRIIFRLFDGVYDGVPDITDISQLKNANMVGFGWMDELNAHGMCRTPLFMSLDGSKMTFFKRHNYQLIGNFPVEKKYIDGFYVQLFLFNMEDKNAESELLDAMDWELEIHEFSDRKLMDILIEYSGCYTKWFGRMTREEHEAIVAREKEQTKARLERAFAENAKFFLLRYGANAGFVSVCGKKIDNLYIEFVFHETGLGTKLLEYAKNIAGDGAYAVIPECSYKKELTHMCEKAGIIIKSE